MDREAAALHSTSYVEVVLWKKEIIKQIHNKLYGSNNSLWIKI
jgi:hypothetical protein